MKKSLVFLGILAVLLFSGCGQQTAKESEASPAPVEEPMEEGDLSVSIDPLENTDALRGIFAALPKRDGESEFVSRGDCTGELIATKGEYIYILRDYTLEICRMDSEGAVSVTTVQTGLFWQEENSPNRWSGQEKQCASLLVNGNRLVILSDLYAYSLADADGQWSGVDSSRCVVDIYDLSKPEEPRWMRSFAQTGSQSCSLIADGRLYLVTDREIYGDDTLGEGTLPGWWQGQAWTALDAEKILCCDRGVSAYVQLGIYPLETASEPDVRALVGCGREGLLCERGFYALLPEKEGSAVYFLPVENGIIVEAVGSYFRERYASVSELTGAGHSLCRLQDGDLRAEGYGWQRRYGENILALALTDNAVHLALLGGTTHEEINDLTLGWDFRAAIDADCAIFTDVERGLIGMPCEDGYSLYALEDGEFHHVLDCFSSDLTQNRRVICKGNTLFVADRKQLFTIDLDNREVKGIISFQP